VFDIRARLTKTIYESKGEAHLAATGIKLASDIVDAVVLPSMRQAEEDDKAEAPFVEAVLEEFVEARELGTHRHCRDRHCRHINRQPLRQTTDEAFL
jgi:hypothetical protein